MAKKSKAERLIRFIRPEQLEAHLKDGWKVLERGTEMVTIYVIDQIENNI